MSEPSRPPVSLDVVRAAVERALELRSLRQVAREVGLSTRGLKLFIGGNSSQKRTVHLLRDWYARHGAEVVGMSPETAAALLGQLLHDLPDAQRETGVLMILNAVEVLYRQIQRPPPPWIDEVLHRRPDPLGG